MSFFTDSSLCFIPSGVKNGKAYSIVPTDGTGDLTFSRASNATRVVLDASGQQRLEKVRTNLLTYSNDFSNAAWTKVGGTTLTAGQADYLGGTNAWKWEATGVGTIQLAQNPAGSTIRTASIYAKAGSVSTINLWVGSAVTFNLSTGAVTSGTGVITSVGGGWYRCSAFGNSISHNPYFTSASAGDYVLISFAQMEEGDIATDPITTLGSAVSVGPVSGLPRLDYSGGASCPSLLLEPQRTNLALYSEQFDNAWWNKSGNIAVTANQTTSPDGYTNADLLYGASSGTISSIQKNLGAASVATYTNSIFVKYSGKRWFYIFEFSGNSGANFFDIQNGVLGTQNFGSGGFIIPYGNGWYRVGFSQALTSGSAWAIYGVSDADDSYTNTASGTDGALIYGAQMEVGAYATSYIPTLSSAVTRVADSASKTGISSLIGQTAGTLFVEFDFQKDIDSAYRISLSDGTTSNRIQLGTFGNEVQVYVQTAGVTQVFALGGTITTGTHKMALAYASNDYVAYLDGSAVITDTSASVPACSKLGFEIPDGTGLFEHPLKQTLLFKTRLSNADLATLTTL